MRRSISVGAAALSLTLVLAACASTTDNNETSPTVTDQPGTESEAPSEDPVAPVAGDTCEDAIANPAESTGTSITLWVDETRIDFFTDIKECYEAKSGVALELVQKVQDDTRSELVSQAAQSTGPDVFIGAHDWLGELQANGVVTDVPLAGQADLFNDVAVTAATFNGQTYGVPVNIENIALIRNNELTTETPTTWDEALTISAELGDMTFPVGIQIGGGGAPYNAFPLQSSFGVGVLAQDEDGSFNDTVLMGENGAAYAEFLADAGAQGILTDSMEYDVVQDAFMDSKTPFVISGPWMSSAFVGAGMDVSILPIPSAGGQEARPFAGVQLAYVGAFGGNKADAMDFVLNFIGSEEIQLKLYEELGRLPALKAAAESDVVQSDEHIQGFAAAGVNALPMPNIPAMGQFWGDWGNAIIDILNGNAADPAARWAEAVTNIEGLIAAS